MLRADFTPDLVSTIVPVYNRGAMLRQAVASVIAQTYRPIEILIVDDGSTDDTADVAADLALKHAGIVKVYRQDNAGPGVARQRGVEQCRGEFVQFLDSDDRLLPDKCALQVAALRSDTDADICYGRCYSVNANGMHSADRQHRCDELHRELFPAILAGRLWPTLVPLYRRKLLTRVPAWPPIRQLEDMLFDAQVAKCRPQLAYVNEYVAEVFAHGEGHLGQLWTFDTRAHRERTGAYLAIVRCAREATVPTDGREMQRFARELFRAGRAAAKCGLVDEAKALIVASKSLANTRRWELRLFAGISTIIGWRAAGELANLFEKLRS